MKNFNPSEYYFLTDHLGSSVCSPKSKGLGLIKEYYNLKHASQIVMPSREIIDEYGNITVYISLQEFAINPESLLDIIESKKNIDGEYRCGFVIGTESCHATPIIYIKNGDKQMLLVADSKNVNSWVISSLVEGLSSKNVQVYAVELTRQADNFSCYTDAMVFTKDCTAKIAGSPEQYIIPDLMMQLQSRKYTKDGIQYVRLPNSLLKTSQISEFTEFNREETDKPIHRGESLSKFRERYIEVQNIKGSEKLVNGYLRQKGIKFMDIIEIQFYINELSAELKGNLPTELRTIFIREAKEELKRQGTSNPREGLHNFAERFCKRCLDKQQSERSKKVLDRWNPESVSERTLKELKEQRRQELDDVRKMRNPSGNKDFSI